MQKNNLKFVFIYLSIVILILILSFIDIGLFSNEGFINLFQKITFTIPVLFIISAFLAFKIAENRIVLVSISFLIISISSSLVKLVTAGIFSEGLIADFLILPDWSSFFRLLPFMFSVSLSLLFIIPEKAGKISLGPVKVVFSLTPFLFFLIPIEETELFLLQYQYAGFFLPWPLIISALLPVAGYYLYKDRRSGVFAAALSSVLLLSMLPEMFLLSAIPRDVCSLVSGIILLHALYRVYWESSYVDELTGLFNRRALDEKLKGLRKNYTLSMVDIDHFKNFNDTFGHDEGDNVLRLVASILHQHFRNSAFRYGGEEFCIIFRKTGLKKSMEAMNAARADIEEHMFSIRKKNVKRKKSGRMKSQSRVKKVKLTISAGISMPSGAAKEADDVLKIADKALYKAKENGRNRVEYAKSR